MSKKLQENEDEIKKNCKWQIKIGITENFRYTGINMIGSIQ